MVLVFAGLASSPYNPHSLEAGISPVLYAIGTIQAEVSIVSRDVIADRVTCGC